MCFYVKSFNILLRSWWWTWGVMLALLLARKGIPVTLIEQHKSFNRSFRGEVFHSSIMEIVDELGLIKG